MPPNNCDPALAPPDAEHGQQGCPKCGVEMEPIESTVEGLPLQQLQLCPNCYLVMWSDQDGLHLRQGVPMKDGSPRSEPALGQPGRLVGEPTDC